MSLGISIQYFHTKIKNCLYLLYKDTTTDTPPIQTEESTTTFQSIFYRAGKMAVPQHTITIVYQYHLTALIIMYKIDEKVFRLFPDVLTEYPFFLSVVYTANGSGWDNYGPDR